MSLASWTARDEPHVTVLQLDDKRIDWLMIQVSWSITRDLFVNLAVYLWLSYKHIGRAAMYLFFIFVKSWPHGGARHMGRLPTNMVNTCLIAGFRAGLPARAKCCKAKRIWRGRVPKRDFRRS